MTPRRCPGLDRLARLADWARLAGLLILACVTVSTAACNRSSETATAPAGSPAAEPTAAPAGPATTPAAPAGSTVTPAGPTAAPAADACASISDWRSEIIEMPPEFAPTLPAGREELRFAPGMFKPESPGYFTYAFVIQLAQPMPADRAQIDSLLDRYYQGLVAAVATDRGLTIPIERVDATVTGQAPAFQATVSMYDAFVTGKPLTLHMDVTMTGACLRAAASPQPRTHEVWQQLAQATACLPCAP
jgi:hypothetical protein